jgi:hypothetical protein
MMTRIMIMPVTRHGIRHSAATLIRVRLGHSESVGVRGPGCAARGRLGARPYRFNFNLRPVSRSL